MRGAAHRSHRYLKNPRLRSAQDRTARRPSLTKAGSGLGPSSDSVAAKKRSRCFSRICTMTESAGSRGVGGAGARSRRRPAVVAPRPQTQKDSSSVPESPGTWRPPLDANKGGAETSAALEQAGGQSGNTVAAGIPTIKFTAARPKTRQSLSYCRTTACSESREFALVRSGSSDERVQQRRHECPRYRPLRGLERLRRAYRSRSRRTRSLGCGRSTTPSRSMRWMRSTSRSPVCCRCK
jgi:hypothetical protein